jgi:hypothetical protein
LKIARLVAHGLSVIPVTGRQLREDPDGVVYRVQLALTGASQRIRLLAE